MPITSLMDMLNAGQDKGFFPPAPAAPGQGNPFQQLLGSIMPPSIYTPPTQAQGPGGMIGRILDPAVALPAAQALMGNQGDMANFGNALGAAGAGMQRNKTLRWLKAKHPDIYEMVAEGGMTTADAFDYAQRRQKMEMDQNAPNLINMGDGVLYDSKAGRFIESPRAGMRREDVPTSIQEYERAQSDPGYKDWMQTGKGRDSNLMAGDRAAIREADDAAMAAQNVVDQLSSVITSDASGKSLNDRAGSGMWADMQALGARNDPTGGYLFDQETGQATTELQNVVTGQALSSLKAIFGAAPTEGERRILLEMQASVDKSPEERKIIIERAIKAAQRRLAFNQDRASELRGGTYYQPRGGDISGPSAGGGSTSGGLRWKVVE